MSDRAPDHPADRPGPDDPLAHELNSLAGSGAEPDLDALYLSVQGKLQAEQGLAATLRSMSTPVRAVLAGALMLVPAAITYVTWYRVDGPFYPPQRMGLVVATLAVMGVLAVTVGLRPHQLPSLSRRLVSGGVLLALAGMFVLYSLPEVPAAPGALASHSVGTLLGHSLACITMGLVFGVPLYLALSMFDRGQSPRGPVLALAAGLGANLVLQLHCPITPPLHLLVGHLGAAVLMLAAHQAWVRARAL